MNSTQRQSRRPLRRPHARSSHDQTRGPSLGVLGRLSVRRAEGVQPLKIYGVFFAETPETQLCFGIWEKGQQGLLAVFARGSCPIFQDRRVQVYGYIDPWNRHHPNGYMLNLPVPEREEQLF